MKNIYSPLRSLREGNWFKLICGASYQHLPAIRNLTLAYTLAGADCIDVAADPAVVAAAREGLKAAACLGEEARKRGFGFQGLPWLMVSLNDGEDPHFRKAEFNSAECPIECWRPCEKVCPADAIVFDRINDNFSGVIDQLCYGCGRCIPICPSKLVFTRSYVSTPEVVAPLVLQNDVDALEIHTQVGRLPDFARLWQAILPSIDRLKLIAVSCPDGEGLIDYLRSLFNLIQPLPCPLIWQTDGRQMSGDIGDGTTHAAIKLGQKVLSAGLPGYVQLAGGTNSHTVTKLKISGLLNLEMDTRDWPKFPIPHSQNYIAGIAYGSYARVLLSPVLEQLEKIEMSSHFPSAEHYGYRTTTAMTKETSSSLPPVRLEDNPQLLWQAVALARSLVSQIKSPICVV